MNRVGIVTGVLLTMNGLRWRHNEAYCEGNTSYPRKLVIAKLGGSAITVKSQFETLNMNAIQKIGENLLLARSLRGVHVANHIVLVHGAGSFGHFQARSYGLSGKSVSTRDDWMTGLCATRNSILSLNNVIRDSIIKAGLNVTSLSPFPSVRRDIANQDTTTAAESPQMMYDEIYPLAPAIKNLVLNDTIPLLHGDVILSHSSQGCSILSGDRIVSSLCAAYLLDGNVQPSDIMVVFLTDVAGVFDRPPSDPDAKIISEILVNSQREAALPMCSLAGHDVTGGIAAKLKVAIDLASEGIEVYIVQADSENAAIALAGLKPRIGTRIAKASR